MKTARSASIRVTETLACKISAIAWATDVSANDIVEPLIGDEIDRRFAELPRDIRNRALSKLAPATKADEAKAKA